MNVNDYLSRQYGNPPCWELVTDVMQTELGQGVTAFKTVNTSIRAIASAFRLALQKSSQGFGRISEPLDYSIVLLGKTSKLGFHHCGVFWQGSVLHATTDVTLYQDIASILDEYKMVEYWSRE